MKFTREQVTEIANQLTQSKRGFGVLSSFVGAKNFSYDGKADFQNLTFKFPRTKCVDGKQANHLKIELNSSDEYDVTFGYIHGMNFTERETKTGVYCDQLKGLFEDFTGLYLSFS